MNPAVRGGLLLLLIATAPGCDRLFDKGARDDVLEGDKRARGSNPASAIPSYEAALDGTAKSAEVHYRLAILYADKLKSPVDALHHYARYLELAPKGAHAKEAEAFKVEGQRQVMAEFTKGYAMTQAEAIRMKNENQRLQEALAQLRNQQKLAPPPPGSGGKNGEGQRKPIPEGARTYVVQPGDNFGKISLKFYKTKAKAQQIQNANFLPQAGTPVIKPGMVLVVP